MWIRICVLSLALIGTLCQAADTVSFDKSKISLPDGKLEKANIVFMPDQKLLVVSRPDQAEIKIPYDSVLSVAQSLGGREIGALNIAFGITGLLMAKKYHYLYVDYKEKDYTKHLVLQLNNSEWKQIVEIAGREIGKPVENLNESASAKKKPGSGQPEARAPSIAQPGPAPTAIKTQDVPVENAKSVQDKSQQIYALPGEVEIRLTRVTMEGEGGAQAPGEFRILQGNTKIVSVGTDKRIMVRPWSQTAKPENDGVLCIAGRIEKGKPDLFWSVDSWISDDKGQKNDSGDKAGLSDGREFTLLFNVPRNSQKLSLHLGDALAIDLAPFLPPPVQTEQKAASPAETRQEPRTGNPISLCFSAYEFGSRRDGSAIGAMQETFASQKAAELNQKYIQLYNEALGKAGSYQYIDSNKLTMKKEKHNLSITEAIKENQLCGCINVHSFPGNTVGWKKKLRLKTTWEIVGALGWKYKFETNAVTRETHGVMPDPLDPQLESAYLDLGRENAMTFSEKLSELMKDEAFVQKLRNESKTK
jgi:hypothetical protein